MPQRRSSTTSKPKKVVKKIVAPVNYTARPVFLTLKNPPQKKILPFIKRVGDKVRISARKVHDAFPNSIQIVATYGGRNHIMQFTSKGVPRWVAVKSV